MSGKLRLLPLGGLGEIGKNMTVVEYEGRIVVVDCGLRFPTAEMMGIDKSQDKGPCQGLTLDCIAKMGCALPPAVVSPAMPLEAKAHVTGLLDPLPVRRLAGRTFGPEPDPPLSFG